MAAESTVQGVVESIERFRILCVGKTGVGKSSLTNIVFGIKDASVSQYEAGESDIEQEYTSNMNKFFVMHDSKGFEIGNNEILDTAKTFIAGRGKCEPDIKKRIHAIWLCTATPVYGGRVFESGDEEILQIATENGIPTLIVFTKYDKLVQNKKKKVTKSNSSIETVKDKATRDTIFAEASKELDKCANSAIGKLPFKMPYAKVSIHPGCDADVSTLIEKTRSLMFEQNPDLWIMWVTAQRASISAKVNACIDTGINCLAGAIPGVGTLLLRNCLARVHQDIVTLWNFEPKSTQILDSEDFKLLMLYLVEEVCVEEPRRSSSLDNVDKINNFVALVTAASAAIAPPAAILGLSYLFVKWVSDAVLENVPKVERLIMAYTVDLILVLKSCFNFMLMKPEFAGETNWKFLMEAFEGYEETEDRKKNHEFCLKTIQGTKDLLRYREAFRNKIQQLLDGSKA